MKNGRTSRRVCRTNTDPTSALTSIIQKHLATLRKQQKFETRTDFQLYPSNPIPPRLYGVIKAHKFEKMLSRASYSFNNWHSTLWHFSISGRIDSTYAK